MFYLHVIEDNIMKICHTTRVMFLSCKIFFQFMNLFFVDINVDIMELDSDQVCLLFLQRVRPY